MKYFTFLFFGLILSQTANAFEAPSRASMGRPATFDTFETVPGYKIKFSFNVILDCLTEGKLNLKKYESEEVLPSTDTGKPTAVRIVNLYAKAAPNCSSQSKSGSKQTYELSADTKRMTHVYLTYENPISLENAETVK